MKLLKSFVPLLVLFLIEDVTARPGMYKLLTVPAYPSAIQHFGSPTPDKITFGSGHASGCNYNSNIGGYVVGHKGSNNGPQVGNNVGVSI